MEEIQTNAIIKCRDSILECLNCTEVLTKLYARGRLTRVQLEDIESENTETRQGKALLNRLVRMKGGWFYDFLEILIATNQQHIATTINDKYKDLGGEMPVDVAETKKVLDRLGWKEAASACRYDTTHVVKKEQESTNSATTEQQPAQAEMQIQMNKEEIDSDEIDFK